YSPLAAWQICRAASVFTFRASLVLSVSFGRWDWTPSSALSRGLWPMRNFASVLTLGLLLNSARPAEPVSASSLIEQLGSAPFAQRRAALKALDKLGPDALEELRRAAKGDDPELRRQCQELVRRIELRCESTRLLMPKRVHLSYQNIPLAEAIADFNK